MRYFILIVFNLLVITITDGAVIETVCVIDQSNSRENGDEFRITAIDTDKPKVLFPSGEAYEFGRLYESESIIVLLSIAELTGSTTTLHLDKQSKTFLLVEMTAFDLKMEPSHSHGNWYIDFAKEPDNNKDR